MFAINILGAGIPGFLIVFFPRFAERYVLWEGQDYGTMAILGSIWLAIGLTSILGVFRPKPFLGVFVVQFIYKSIWLLAFVVPQLMQQHPIPPAVYVLIAIFLLLILEFGLFIRPADFRQNRASTTLTPTV